MERRTPVELDCHFGLKISSFQKNYTVVDLKRKGLCMVKWVYRLIKKAKIISMFLLENIHFLPLI